MKTLCNDFSGFYKQSLLKNCIRSVGRHRLSPWYKMKWKHWKLKAENFKTFNLPE